MKEIYIYSDEEMSIDKNIIEGYVTEDNFEEFDFSDIDNSRLSDIFEIKYGTLFHGFKNIDFNKFKLKDPDNSHSIYLESFSFCDNLHNVKFHVHISELNLQKTTSKVFTEPLKIDHLTLSNYWQEEFEAILKAFANCEIGRLESCGNVISNFHLLSKMKIESLDICEFNQILSFDDLENITFETEIHEDLGKFDINNDNVKFLYWY